MICNNLTFVEAVQRLRVLYIEEENALLDTLGKRSSYTSMPHSTIYHAETENTDYDIENYSFTLSKNPSNPIKHLCGKDFVITEKDLFCMTWKIVSVKCTHKYPYCN